MPSTDRYVARKWDGDDAYSWAVIDKRTNKPVDIMLTGLNKQQASHYKRMAETGREPSKNSTPKGGTGGKSNGQ